MGYVCDTAGQREHGVQPGSGAAYSFASNSDFVGQVDFNTNGASNVAGTIRTYEATRDLIDTIENKWSGTSVSKYDYDNDVLARRTKVANTGTAFSTNRFSLWGYNERSELTSAKRYDCNTSGSCLTDSNTNSPVSGQQFTYTFDNIGNRTEDTGDPDANTTGYTANNLNQYTATTSPTESFTYDNDGNLTQDALWDYTWDAENRLTAITARNPTSGSKKLGFDYDHMNRRVRKRVYTWNTFGLGFWNTTPSVDRKFVYDGWNLIEELNGLSSDAIITRFTWGLDLSGQNGGPSIDGIHGAGGIGGLLACNDNSGSKNYLYFYNANGDVGQLMDVSGGTSTPAVKYEYYPYGGELLASGLAALVSPFRFSTKYWDAETQNLYYGYRYLRPKMGRWVNRDPIEEIGGYALFTSLRNAPIHWIDSIGWQSSQPTPPTTQPMYPPIDWNVNPRTYNCAGLAFGNYRPLNRDDVKGILGRFRKLTTCDMQCGECEVKCWFWEYLLDVVDLNGVQDTFYRPHLDFHIVCGQASCGGGADPERVYGKNGRGPITGPSLGVEHRPRGDGDYVDDKGPPLLPELLRFKRRRNMTETCYCSPISGLPK